jgi:predicted RNA-binding Zn-ribbon protein involved in translation (DUF1610 family)
VIRRNEMRIKDIKSQYRRDFHAVYVCEGCGKTEEGRGYDDRYFHDKVIPTMICKNCGKSRIELGITAEKTSTKYPEGMQI